jgi:flagellar biosynthesis regulator FlbT
LNKLPKFAHIGSICLLQAALQVAFASRCGAMDAWRVDFRAAQSFELRTDYQQAAAAYGRALKQLPTSDDNGRAMVEAALAADFIMLKQYDKGLAHGEQTVQIVRRLRERNKLEPDVLLGVEGLRDACQDHLSQYIYQDRKLAKYDEISKLKEALAAASGLDRLRSVSQRHADVRMFIAAVKDDEALTKLQKILKEVSSRSPEYWPLMMEIASIKAKHGHPDAAVEAKKEMRKRYSEHDVLCLFGKSQYWVGDYSGAIATLDHAIANLKQRKDNTLHDELQIQELYISLFLDQANQKQAEPHFRRQVALLSGNPRDKEALLAAKKSLSTCLRQLHRDKEADAVYKMKDMPDRPDDQFFLTDEDKAALKKSQSQAQLKTEQKP